MRRSVVISIIWTAILSAKAFAGGAESHGGSVVSCPGKAPVVLDYYQATVPTVGGGTPELLDVEHMSHEEMQGALFSGIKFTGLMNPWMQAANALGAPSTWLAGSLQTVPDTDPAYTLPPGCSLKQAAVRQGTVVYIDPATWNALSPAQQAILEFHEQLFYLAEEKGKQTSVEVRMVIRNLLMKKRDQLALAQSVRELGYTFFWWEDYANRTYQAEAGKIGLSWIYNDPKSTTSLIQIQGQGQLMIRCGDGFDGSPDVSCTTVDLDRHPRVPQCRLVDFMSMDHGFAFKCEGKDDLIFNEVGANPPHSESAN